MNNYYQKYKNKYLQLKAKYVFRDKETRELQQPTTL